MTKTGGKILVMMLNPESEYFKEHTRREGSYFRKVRHIDLAAIKEYIARFYTITRESYFLGICSQHVFDSTDKKQAALYIIVGRKHVR